MFSGIDGDGNPTLSDEEWAHLDAECTRLLGAWSDNIWLDPNEISGFEYGFELGYRVAKGEVIG